MPSRIAWRLALAALVATLCRGAAADASIPCDLKLRYGSHAQGPPGQLHLDLVLVAAGSPCRVSGFADVELIGPVDPLLGSIYTLPVQPPRTTGVSLRAGARAHAVLTWLPPSRRADRWVPGYLRVVVRTSAGPSLPLALPWSYGPVLRQDAATHPGTYVGPIRPGAGN